MGSVTPSSVVVSSRSEGLGRALSAIAQTVADNPDLKAIFSRVAEAARQVLPFDTMLVNVGQDPDVPPDEPENDVCSVFAVAGDAAAEEIRQESES
jgi:hypothetical protein